MGQRARAAMVERAHMSTPTHVLFIQSQEGFGADSVVHSHLMRNLDREQFVVHVACTVGSGSRVPASLAQLREIPDIRLRETQFMPGIRERGLRTVLGTAPRALLAPLEFVRLRQYVERHRIRIIHSSERPRDAVYNVALSRVTSAKSVVHVHVKWSELYSAPAKWAVNHADAIFSISNYVTSTVVGMGRSPDTIHTVLNCVETSRWDPTTDGSGVRRELSIAEGDFVLASVSRLFAWKGQRELLRAFAQVLETVPNVVLLIVGADAPHEGTSFTAELEQLASELGVSDRVRFTGARSDIPEVMAACDIFTMPSFEEPFGLVFLEAMAMERPVVAIDNGGTPEVVEHGKAGLLSPPWDIERLAKNITTLLEDGELRRRYGGYGRARVLERFNAQRMTDEASQAYRSIIAGGAR